MTGTVTRVRGLKRFKHSVSGIWYTYHRATGTKLEPPHKFGTPEFFDALAKAESKHKAKKPRSGTFGAAIISYRSSPDFITLRERTKRDYELVMDYLGGLADMPISEITQKFVIDVRDKAFKQKKRRFANYTVSVLSVILGHAAERGMIPINPAKGTRKIKKRMDEPEANAAWLDEEKQAVLEFAPLHMKAPIAVARWLGLRQGDILALPKTCYRNGLIIVKTSKTGTLLRLPVEGELKAILDTIPDHNALTLFANSKGTPWSADGFRSVFFKLLRKLELEEKIRKGLTFHGLRTSFAQEAALSGFDERQTADALGHSDTKTTRGYIRNAVSGRNAATVVSMLSKQKHGK